MHNDTKLLVSAKVSELTLCLFYFPFVLIRKEPKGSRANQEPPADWPVPSAPGRFLPFVLIRKEQRIKAAVIGPRARP